MAYYEIVGPEIYRVGVEAGTSVTLHNQVVGVPSGKEKNFSYLVVGDASQLDGLAAPYDEEETTQVMHLEPLERSDLFAFWQQNANTDQVTGREFEPRRF